MIIRRWSGERIVKTSVVALDVFVLFLPLSMLVPIGKRVMYAGFVVSDRAYLQFASALYFLSSLRYTE